MKPLRVIVLQHVLEQFERSNTGAPAVHALPGAELRLWGAKDVPLNPEGLRASGAYLLFPDADATTPAADDVHTLVVVDASWSQTRRMVQSEMLRGLPRLSLTPSAERRSLRRAPAGGMSTLEAMAMALEWHGEPEAAAQLHAVHDGLLKRVLKTRGYL